MPKVIGVDLDGVLRDIHTPLCEMWWWKTGIWKTPADIVGWSAHEYLEVERAGMTVEEFYQWWFNHDYIYSLATVIPRSQDGVRQLADKWDLVLVSSQPTATARRRSIEFVDAHFAGLFTGIYFGRNKSLIHVDALIDDAIHNLAEHPAPHPILFDQPWNQDETIWPGYRSANWGIRAYRARGWQEVVDYFFGRELKI